MAHEDLKELAKSAQARKAASFIAAHRPEVEGALEQATKPLKERIVELEGLLTNAVENGDRLAKALEDSEARAKALEERVAKAEAKAAAAKPAQKRGR